MSKRFKLVIIAPAMMMGVFAPAATASAASSSIAAAPAAATKRVGTYDVIARSAWPYRGASARDRVIITRRGNTYTVSPQKPVYHNAQNVSLELMHRCVVWNSFRRTCGPDEVKMFGSNKPFSETVYYYEKTANYWTWRAVSRRF